MDYEIAKRDWIQKKIEITRSLGAYKAQLTRRQKDPEKFGKVTKELLDNIERLEKELKE